MDIQAIATRPEVIGAGITLALTVAGILLGREKLYKIAVGWFTLISSRTSSFAFRKIERQIIEPIAEAARDVADGNINGLDDTKIVDHEDKGETNS